MKKEKCWSNWDEIMHSSEKFEIQCKEFQESKYLLQESFKFDSNYSRIIFSIKMSRQEAIPDFSLRSLQRMRFQVLLIWSEVI